MQKLARVVPVVEGMVEIYALVTLEADEARAGGAGERLRNLGLPDSRLTLEQERLLEGGGEVDRGRESAIGEVALAGERLLDGCSAAEAQTLTASSSARRVSTRARWRL